MAFSGEKVCFLTGAQKPVIGMGYARTERLPCGWTKGGSIMPHPLRRDVIVKDSGAKQNVIFIDAPASEDVLEELASVFGMGFLGISSDDFLKRDESIRVALVVICPKTELERRHLLRILFANVRKARDLCGTANIIVLLPLRDQACENDLKKYGCRVSPWEGLSVPKIAALMKSALTVAASNEKPVFEFRNKNQLHISNAHGSCELTLPGGRPPVLLRKLLERDRASSLVELARTLDCENLKCIQMSISRLNNVLESIPESLRLSLEIRSSGYGKGYRLVILNKRTF
jgi:hypothetical protein